MMNRSTSNKPSLILFLIKLGIAKNTNQAKIILLGVFALVMVLLFLQVNSMTTTSNEPLDQPSRNQTTPSES